MDNVLQSPKEWQQALARRFRDGRLELKLKQASLATRAGVSLASLRRFERTGEVSLKHLMRILHALGRLHEIDALLRPAPAATMAELEAQVARPISKRGRR